MLKQGITRVIYSISRRYARPRIRRNTILCFIRPMPSLFAVRAAPHRKSQEIPVSNGNPSILSYLASSNTKRCIVKGYIQSIWNFWMTSKSQASLPNTMPSPPTNSTIGEFQIHRRITIDSLCCKADEADPASTGPKEEHDHAHGPKAFPTSDAIPIRARCLKPERPGTTVNRPSPWFVHSQQRSGIGLATQLCHVDQSDIMANYDGAYHAINASSVDILCPNRGAEDASIIRLDTVWQHDGPWSMIVPPIANLFTNPASSKDLHTHHDADALVQPTTQTTFNEPSQSISRPARPSYTEEQKFFIMYYRIVRELSWPEIEERFANFFHLRTKDGLTSVYYRIRKNWHMDDVLSSNSSPTNDREKVEEKANHFQKEFLEKLK